LGGGRKRARPFAVEKRKKGADKEGEAPVQKILKEKKELFKQRGEGGREGSSPFGGEHLSLHQGKRKKSTALIPIGEQGKMEREIGSQWGKGERCGELRLIKKGKGKKGPGAAQKNKRVVPDGGLERGKKGHQGRKGEEKNNRKTEQRRKWGRGTQTEAIEKNNNNGLF